MDRETTKALFSNDFKNFSSVFYDAIITTSSQEIEQRIQAITDKLSSTKIKNKPAAMLLYLIILLNEYTSTTYTVMRTEINEQIADLYLAHIFVLSFNKFHYFRQNNIEKKHLQLQGKLCSYLYSLCLLMASSDLVLEDAIVMAYTYYQKYAQIELPRMIEIYFIIIDEIEYLIESFRSTYTELNDDDETNLLKRINNAPKGNSTFH